MLKNKQILLEKYISVAVKKALKEQEIQRQKAEKSLYLVYRFPGLKKIMEDLMSPSFSHYIKNINITAPKPTTFKIELINNQEFTIYYVGKNKFTVKIVGKKYNPDNLGDLERASQNIADLLQLHYAPEEGKEQEVADAEMAADLNKASGSSGSGGTFPGSEPTPEIPEETPEESPEIPEETPEDETPIN